MIFYLYCIKPKTNPKEIVYIGFTTDIKRRKREHEKSFPNHKFEVITTSYSEFWIRKIEELLIKNYKSFIENKQHNFLNKNDMGKEPTCYFEEYKEVEFNDQFEGGDWLDK